MRFISAYTFMDKFMKKTTTTNTYTPEVVIKETWTIQILCVQFDTE